MHNTELILEIENVRNVIIIKHKTHTHVFARFNETAVESCHSSEDNKNWSFAIKILYFGVLNRVKL